MPPTRDVAVYAPYAAGIYDAGRRRAGGAERQTVHLSRSLAAQGLKVAHIVFEVGERVPEGGPAPDLVFRAPLAGGRARVAGEMRIIWRAMAAADARVYVFRMASAALGVGAAFCKLHRRKLVFAGANDSDFTLETLEAMQARMYSFGLRRADAIVVQSAQQVVLARERFDGLGRIHELPSFVEEAPPSSGEPDAFLWVSRLATYKQPFRYVDLARELPEARFRMIPVTAPGDTTPDLLAELRRRAQEAPNLEVLRPRPHPEVMALLERAVAVVNTSVLEGMPNVFLEAWARGIPVLTLRFDPDGRVRGRGLGISAGDDWDAFVAGAREMWEKRADRARWAPATRGYIGDVHSPAAVGRRWEELIRSL